jgi:hypothetical protein
MHFTPTSASWLKMVERFFRDLTQNRLKRGIFRDLEGTHHGREILYIDRHNLNPKPFIWTASAQRHPAKSYPRPQGSYVTQSA